MSVDGTIEQRSQQLEKIRKDLRRLIEKAARRSRQPIIDVSYDAPVKLSNSEERAMRRQMGATFGDDFIVAMSFQPKNRRNKPQVTQIRLFLRRRLRIRRRQE